MCERAQRRRLIGYRFVNSVYVRQHDLHFRRRLIGYLQKRGVLITECFRLPVIFRVANSALISSRLPWAAAPCPPPYPVIPCGVTQPGSAI